MEHLVIIDLSIHDLNDFRRYIEKIPKVIAHHHGCYLVEGEVPVIKEGDWRPERVVVIRFPSIQNVEAFFNDPNAKALFEIRHRSTTSKIVVVKGCGNC